MFWDYGNFKKEEERIARLCIVGAVDEGHRQISERSVNETMI